MKYKEDFDEIYLIRDGEIEVFTVNESSKNEGLGTYMLIATLPKLSYFGEYQVALNLKSAFVYRSNSNEETATMCIMNTVFLELIERYPRVKKHFEEVAKLRRNEFRRLQLQALRVFENLEKEKE